MLTPDEQKFLIYWEKNRDKKKGLSGQLSFGFAIGLSISIGIVLNYVSGWYTRATMYANGQSTPLVLIFGVILITFFCNIFYRQHRREMNEQRYLELMYKKKTEESSTSVQQDDCVNSQVNS